MRNIKFNLQFNKQFFIRGAMIGLLLILIIITIRVVAKHNTKGVQTPVMHVASTEHPSTTGPATASKSANALQDISQINPFVDMTLLKQQGQASNQNQSAYNTGLPALPAIPAGQPRPNVGSIPIPSASIPNMPNEIPSAASLSSAAPKIQGVLIGQRGGKNQAVMSDGTVVSEGDHYQDGRIAYIGGSGITFDSGREIKYQ